MAGTASPVPVSTAARATAGACALLCRSLHRQRAGHTRRGGHRAGAGIADAPGRFRQRGRSEPARGSERAAGFSGPQPGAALRALLARRCGLEACAAEILRAQGLSPGARVVEGAGQRRRAQRCPSQGDAGARAHRGCRFARSVRALAGIAHQPFVRGRGPAGAMGAAPGTAPGRARDSRRHLPGDRVISAGIHVFAVGLRRIERGNRNLSFPSGVPFASAGSGARLGRHAADPFAFDGCPDLLLPGRWLAGVRRAGGSPDSECRAPGTGCGGNSEGGDSAAAVGRSENRPPGKAYASSCAFGPPCEANSFRSPAWGASKVWGRAFLGTNGVDGSAPGCGQASRDRRRPARKGCG